MSHVLAISGMLIENTDLCFVLVAFPKFRYRPDLSSRGRPGLPER